MSEPRKKSSVIVVLLSLLTFAGFFGAVVYMLNLNTCEDHTKPGIISLMLGFLVLGFAFLFPVYRRTDSLLASIGLTCLYLFVVAPIWGFAASFVALALYVPYPASCTLG